MCMILSWAGYPAGHPAMGVQELTVWGTMALAAVPLIAARFWKSLCSDAYVAPQFPLGVKVLGVWEPTVAATITLPAEYLGALMQLCQDRRGALTEHTHLGPGRLLLRHGCRGLGT